MANLNLRIVLDTTDVNSYAAILEAAMGDKRINIFYHGDPKWCPCNINGGEPEVPPRRRHYSSDGSAHELFMQHVITVNKKKFNLEWAADWFEKKGYSRATASGAISRLVQEKHLIKTSKGHWCLPPEDPKNAQ